MEDPKLTHRRAGRPQETTVRGASMRGEGSLTPTAGVGDVVRTPPTRELSPPTTVNRDHGDPGVNDGLGTEQVPTAENRAACGLSCLLVAVLASSSRRARGGGGPPAGGGGAAGGARGAGMAGGGGRAPR